MDNKEIQAQFIQWLAKKTGAKSEQELTEVIKKLQSTEGAMEQTIQEFKTAMGEDQSGSMFKEGGKMDYLNCLSKLKKGGVVNCGCGSKIPKVQKALFGAILGAVKGAGTIMKGGASAIKGAKTLSTIGKVANVGQNVLNIGKSISSNTLGSPTNQLQSPTDNTQAVAPLVNTNVVSPLTTLGTRVKPVLKPMNGVKPLNGLKPMVPIATPKLGVV